MFVKVAPVGSEVKEVMIPENSTVAVALTHAKIDSSNYDSIHMNGSPASLGDAVTAGSVIVLTPRIRGGKDNI